MTFAKGAALQDSLGLVHVSLEGNIRRAIDLHEGEAMKEEALKALIRAAVEQIQEEMRQYHREIDAVLQQRNKLHTWRTIVNLRHHAPKAGAGSSCSTLDEVGKEEKMVGMTARSGIDALRKATWGALD